MKYPSLVFDLDGTLTDPAVGIVRCMNYALVSFDYPARAEHEITPHIGPPLEQTLQLLSGSDDENRIKQLVATYRERYGELGYRENSVYPGIVDLLEELKSRSVPMGVCTSKFQKYAVKVLQEFGLADYFDFVSGPEFGMQKSQQLAALLANGAITADALMIGDRAVDITAAASNGMPAAGVLWGYGSLQELQEAGPAHVFSEPAELIAELID